MQLIKYQPVRSKASIKRSRLCVGMATAIQMMNTSFSKSWMRVGRNMSGISHHTEFVIEPEIIQIRRIYEVESQDSECIEEETPDDKFIAIGIYNGFFSFIENGRICVERKVNYCCMCGRKL